MRMTLALILALIGLVVAAPGPLAQQREDAFAVAVSDELIAVSSTFRGARVTVMGVTPQRRAGDLVVVLRGPTQTYVVSRKRRVGGLWVNADPVRFERAPTFFAAVTAEPLSQIVPPRAFWELSLDPTLSAPLVGVTPEDADRAAYRAAFVRLKRARGQYLENPRGLKLYDGGLFKAQFPLPANAQPGLYRIDAYLFRNKTLIAQRNASVLVSRVGVERTLHDLATRHPILYGLAVVALALGAGWAASFLFRRT